MRKVKLIRDSGCRLAIVSLFALFAFSGCSAHPSQASRSTDLSLEQTDSVMRTAVGDSIYIIITEAKKIKAEEIILSSDTTKTSNSITIDVKGKYVPIVQFILANPNLYASDLASFGSYMPCFKLIFIKKKETCILNFDFGLKKWTICDGTGKVIKKYDLSSDDMLRLANMLFPKNDLFKKLINTDKR